MTRDEEVFMSAVLVSTAVVFVVGGTYLFEGPAAVDYLLKIKVPLLLATVGIFLGAALGPFAVALRLMGFPDRAKKFGLACGAAFAAAGVFVALSVLLKGTL